MTVQYRIFYIDNPLPMYDSTLGPTSLEPHTKRDNTTVFSAPKHPSFFPRLPPTDSLLHANSNALLLPLPLPLSRFYVPTHFPTAYILTCSFFFVFPPVRFSNLLSLLSLFGCWILPRSSSIMSAFLYTHHHQQQHHHQHPQHATQMHSNNHHGRTRRGPKMAQQNAQRQFRGVKSMRELAEAPAVTAFRARFEAGRSFDLDDDLEFCPNLLTDEDVR